ncbi:hypothetical protein ACFSUS_10570 [Spirosoma soli]|uniref:BetI-type transcriptional repressor C-terminal domain-containing protein n=1 Tax=Spirosoma soli TaxID=1770529 RepID=A0ABW5M437_9BACT
MEGTTLETRMLADTLGAFGEGSASTISPERGILLLEGWLNALRGDVGAERIVAEAGVLRDHLKSGNIDGDTVRHLLINMASHTLAISNEPSVDGTTSGRLKQLASALRNFSSQF